MNSSHRNATTRPALVRVTPALVIALGFIALPAAAQFGNTFPTVGNVGIGTTAPSDFLEISSVAVNADLQIRLNAAANHYAQQTYYEAGVLKWNIYNDFNNDNLTYGNGTGPKMCISQAGNFGIGTTSPTQKLDVNGSVNVSGSVVVAGNIAAKYQDVAEWVEATAALEPGTVVVLNRDKSNEVMASEHAYDTAVAGVVSAQPGVILGEPSLSKEKIATTGRVRVRVDATKDPILVGDLLVSSDEPGVAMKSEPVDLGGTKIHRPGTIIGKALQPLSSGKGEILVLLTLQ